MRIAYGIVLIAAALAVTGCQDPLHGEHLPQTPYERYERLHGRVRPQYVPGFEPSLRDQLRPLE